MRISHIIVLIMIFTVVLAQSISSFASVCGDAPPAQFLSKNDVTLKGKLELGANLLSKKIGKATLAGDIESQRHHIYTEYPDANKARTDAYFLYLFCRIIFDPKNTQSTQEKLKALTEFRKQISETPSRPIKPKSDKSTVAINVTPAPLTIIFEGRKWSTDWNSNSVFLEPKAGMKTPANFDPKNIIWVKRFWDTNWREGAVQVNLILSANDPNSVGVIEEIGFEVESVERISGKLLFAMLRSGATGPIYGGTGFISPEIGRYPITSWGGEGRVTKEEVIPYLKPGSPVFFRAVLGMDNSEVENITESRTETIGVLISIYAKIAINGRHEEFRSKDKFRYAFLSKNIDSPDSEMRGTKISYSVLKRLQQRAYIGK